MPAIYRSIQTNYWRDSWIIELSSEHKYFYLYLLTNNNLTQCGVYEISLKQMECETNLDKERLLELLAFFESNKKIKYNHNTSEICIINFSKYNYNPSEQIKTHIRKVFKLVKDKTLILYVYGIESIYKEFIEAKDLPQRKLLDPLNTPYRVSPDPLDTLSLDNIDCVEVPDSEIIDHQEGVSLIKTTINLQKQKQISSCVDEKLKIEILDFYGFRDLQHKDKANEVTEFINFISQNNKLEYFREQFFSYRKYKESTCEKIHGFKTYLGTINNEYSDGGWCAENWAHKLEMSEKQFSENNTSKKSNLIEQYNATNTDHSSSAL